MRNRFGCKWFFLRCAGMLAVVLVSAATAHAQQEFQVATIKPSAPETQKQMQIRGNKFATFGTTLEDLLKFAYNVHASQIVGGPEWIRHDRYDLIADPEVDHRLTQDEIKPMLARLIVKRFQLTVVHDKQELPVFALVELRHPPALVKIDEKAGTYLSGGLDPSGILYVHDGTLADFAHYLQRFAPRELDRPVVDETNITGRFEFALHFALEKNPGEPSQSDAQSPDVFGAVEQQYGLKLKATKAEVDVLRISSITQPTPN